MFRLDHPNARVCESIRTDHKGLAEQVLRIMVPPQGADPATFRHALTVLDKPVVEVIAMWLDE